MTQLKFKQNLNVSIIGGCDCKNLTVNTIKISNLKWGLKEHDEENESKMTSYLYFF
jgi:hypothetical protein